MKTLQNMEQNENLSRYTNIVIQVFGLVPQQKALNAKAIKCIGTKPQLFKVLSVWWLVHPP
jgi:hypothetical protein